MNIDEREKLFRFRDSSPEAIAMRLRAARETIAPLQKDFAALIPINPKTYHAQEKVGSPSIQVLDFIYRNGRIGPNFILLGEFLTLPGDVQIALEAALRASN